jgi:hypothetical protein
MYKFPLLIGIVVLLPACGGDPAAARRDGYMNAQVTRAFDVYHRGDAQHSRGTLEWIQESQTGRWVLTIRSRDPGTNDVVSINLTTRVNHWQVGTYDLEHLVFQCGSPDGASAMFIKEDIRYISDGGTLTITAVSDESVDGHFELTAAAHMRNPQSGCPAWIKLANPPRIDVWGEFSAVQRRDSMHFGVDY